MSAQAAMAQAAHYRPLNVRDALTYLDQVKVSNAARSYGVTRLSKGVIEGLTSSAPLHSSLFATLPSFFDPPLLFLFFQVQFADLPDVYNRFLDVMKEFKGQT